MTPLGWMITAIGYRITEICVKCTGSICTVTEINKSKAKLVVFECWGSMIEICSDE